MCVPLMSCGVTLSAYALKILPRQCDVRIINIVWSYLYLVVDYLARIDKTIGKTDLAQVSL